jgi:outer membrane protein TolC
MRSLQATCHRGWIGQLSMLVPAMLLLAGCAVGPKYKTPSLPTPPAYKEMGNWKTAQPSDHNLGGNWWEIFNDPQLNALEQQIDVSNQNLKAAVAQYQEARAALRSARADYYPTVGTAPSAMRERYSNNRPASAVSDGLTFNDFVVPVDVSYQANVWGRVSKNVESYREQAQASAADLAVVNLTMHADLAIDYFAARTFDAEEKLLQNTVAQYQQALELNEERYQGGLASEVEVEQRSLKPHGRNSWMWELPERSMSMRLQYWSARLRQISVCLRYRLQLRHRRSLLAFHPSCWKGVLISPLPNAG